MAADGVARLRGAKPLHPRGVVVTGRLRRHGATSGVEWVDGKGDDVVLARLSRGGGLPAWLPDVHGLALRVPDGNGPADLLLSTTGTLPGLRHVLAPHVDVAAGTYTSLWPYRGPRGPVMLGARALAVGRQRLPAEPEALGGALAVEPLHLRLAWATLGGPWQPFASLELRGPAQDDVDPPVHFDPLDPPTGLATYPWAAALRAPAYARARAVGPDTKEGTVMTERPEGSDVAPDDDARPGELDDAARAGVANDVGSAAAKEDAPEPDDPRKPDSPPDLTGASRRYVLRKTLREFQHDQVTDLAAALTYWAVLAVAPAALALVSLLSVVGDGEQVVRDVMDTVGDVAPGLDLAVVEDIVRNLASQQGGGLALVVGLLVALWSASGYVNAFSRAMNRIYEVDEGRPVWKLRPAMLLVTLVTLVLVAVTCAAMALSGPVAAAIGSAIGLSDAVVTVWDVAKWPVIVLLVALTIAILYYGTPNVRQPRFRWISVGSFVAILVWAVGTAAFGLYVAFFGSYNETYGALAGVIVFLLWLWLTNNALLFGAELDAELERARQLQAGMPAEESLQLPPRDTAASRKREKQIAEDLAIGRALRLTRGRRAEPTPTDRSGRGPHPTRSR